MSDVSIITRTVALRSPLMPFPRLVVCLVFPPFPFFARLYLSHTYRVEILPLLSLPFSSKYALNPFAVLAVSIMPTDAAALPSPPDIPPWKGGTRPYSVGGNIHSKGQVTRPGSGSYQNGNGTPVTRPIFPNIKDLQDQAALLNVNETTPVSMGNANARGGDNLLT